MEMKIEPLALPGVDTQRPIVIAGPCSAETEEQVLETAQGLASRGVKIFRAGIWKPRTKPGGFEGIGAEGFGGGTINHAWSGGPLTLLSQKVCGIEPTSPGFRTFKIAPQLGSLSEASASLETHYGTIQVSIKKKGKRMKFDLQIPEGTSAELIRPNGTRKHLDPGHHQVD